MHKRLTVQSLIFADYRPMFASSQEFYTLGVQVYFTRISGSYHYEYMSHLVSYKCFRRTQYITSIGLFYKNVGFYSECV